jgi:MFS family permease
MTPRANSRRFVLIVLPFSAAYFVSYFFRTINALISGTLSEDLHLAAPQLGLLTSVYFLTFALVQIPSGILLDRFGPRRVQSALLLVAAVGSALFGVADRFEILLLARALIGLGVAVSLIAGLKAISLWFPKERLALFNGCFIMIGTLGVVCATMPAEWFLHFVGWKSLFELMSGLCVISAVVIFSLVPESVASNSMPGKRPIQLGEIFTDRRFWRLVPLSTMCISTAWALQGLWATPWFTDVDRIDRTSVVYRLLVMAVSLSAGAMLFGLVTDKLRRHGVRAQTILIVIAILFIFAQIALIFDLPLSPYITWSIIAGVGAATVISYSIISESFPNQISGQASSALNTFHIGGAFAIQAVIGVIVGQWAEDGGHYPALAYKTAFGCNLTIQLIALGWFLVPSGRNHRYLSAIRRQIYPRWRQDP